MTVTLEANLALSDKTGVIMTSTGKGGSKDLISAGAFELSIQI